MGFGFPIGGCFLIWATTSDHGPKRSRYHRDLAVGLPLPFPGQDGAAVRLPERRGADAGSRPRGAHHRPRLPRGPGGGGNGLHVTNLPFFNGRMEVARAPPNRVLSLSLLMSWPFPHRHVMVVSSHQRKQNTSKVCVSYFFIF